MRRKILLTLGFTVMFSLVLFMLYGIVEKVATKKNLEAKIQSLPVNAWLFKMDSASFKVPEKGDLVLIFFNSGCEHCQYEVKELVNNFNVFDGIQVVLMSSETISAIKSFAAEYKLLGYKNLHLTKINPEDVFENFGKLGVPHIFIYKNGQLIKEFKGETKIEAILKYAKAS